jgi:hypothetical protein
MKEEHSTQVVFPRLAKDLPDVYGISKCITMITETNYCVQSPAKHQVPLLYLLTLQFFLI